MRLIRTEDAVGQVLCHDITQIIKGVTKDAVFRKGHIIKEEDIPVMVERAYKEANPLYPVPKFMGKKELEEMYRKISC